MYGDRQSIHRSQPVKTNQTKTKIKNQTKYRITNHELHMHEQEYTEKIEN